MTNSENHPIDSSAALEVTGGDADLAKVLLETCMVEAPKIISDAREKTASGDFVSVRRCGHSLASAFGSVGAISAAEQARKLEAVHSEDAADYETAITDVENAFQEVSSTVNG